MKRKAWLIVKAVLLLTVIILLLIEPVQKSWISIGLIIFFVISLIIDAVEYRKTNG
jgi:hypothetical protein